MIRMNCREANVSRARWLHLLLMILIGVGFRTAASYGQERPKGDSIENLARGVEDWIRDNVDADVLEQLSQVDQERTLQFFRSVLQKFDANDIYDLASARESAVRVLPVLKQFEETRPLAGWLETRMDYFEASEALRRLVELTPPKPGTPTRLTAPTPEMQRKVWTERLSKRPMPASAQALVPRIKPIFRSAGIPAELIWLAEVESSFNPKARSPKGAAGLFQLMPTTARSLGLSTWPFDERLDAEKNAGAAAKYLRYLYGRFKDWRLALAAYNAGEGRVGQLLENAKPRSFAAIASRLPAETQLYVPKFEATLRKREDVAMTSLGSPR